MAARAGRATAFLAVIPWPGGAGIPRGRDNRTCVTAARPGSAESEVEVGVGVEGNATEQVRAGREVTGGDGWWVWCLRAGDVLADCGPGLAQDVRIDRGAAGSGGRLLCRHARPLRVHEPVGIAAGVAGLSLWLSMDRS